ncbi:MAG: hypothetical protein ABI824_13000 [Acidobacteriota bacterium]
MTAVRIDHPKLDRVSRRWGQIAQTLPPESETEQLGLRRLGPPGPIEIWGRTTGRDLGLDFGHASLREMLEQSVARVQPVTIELGSGTESQPRRSEREVDHEGGPPHCPMR